VRLWQEKRGEVEPEDLSGNLIVQLGVATEALNVQRHKHSGLGWMAATLDGRVEGTGRCSRPSSCGLCVFGHAAVQGQMPAYPCCARRLTDGFERHWLSPGNVPGAFFRCTDLMLAARFRGKADVFLALWVIWPEQPLYRTAPAHLAGTARACPALLECVSIQMVLAPGSSRGCF
jgi:hypothetical protein